MQELIRTHIFTNNQKQKRMKTEDYRPAHIEFMVTPDASPIPESLGEFATDQEAIEFMQKNFFSTNQGITVARFMDNFEKSELRKEYNDIMENMLPKYEQDMRNAIDAYNHAKVAKENAIQLVQASINEAKAIAQEVKRGLKEMQLDENFTWKLPYKGRFYFFTFIDKAVRLVRISDMYETEKTELFSQGKINEDAFDGDVTSKQEYLRHGDRVGMGIIKSDKEANGETPTQRKKGGRPKKG